MPQLFEPAPEAHGSKKRNCPNRRNLKKLVFFWRRITSSIPKTLATNTVFLHF